jgi:2-(1,2-epoxy-1,2-dihydrophenyl)acetyl-CoA isomerase
MTLSDHEVDGLRLSVEDGVLRIVLNRPARRNALTDAETEALIGLFDEVATDESIRVVLISGEGDHYCGGFDLVARNADIDGPSPRVGSIQRRLPTQTHRLIPLMLSVQVPIVSLVRGWAAGLGLQLVLASDFALVAEDASLWQPFTQRGFTPDSGASWMLPRRVGQVRAREMLVLGRTVSGAEAAAWGMVHRALPAAELADAAEALVAELASGPTVALGLTKWLLHTGEFADINAALANEALALEISSRSKDFREGLAAFREKRPPDFQGR